MFDEKIIENIKKNSIGSSKKDKYIKVQKVIKKSLLFTLIGLIVSASMISCSKTEMMIRLNDNIDVTAVDNYFVTYNDDVYELFSEQGISRQSADGGKIDVEDYKKVNGLTEEDLIIYYDLFGREECDKILQAIGYEGWDDYLKQNGYSSFEKWLTSEYEEITRDSKEGKTK